MHSEIIWRKKGGYREKFRSGTWLFSSQQVRWDLILRDNRKIHMFNLHIVWMENSETGPTIFFKLAHIQVQEYLGTLSDLKENSSSRFPAMIFRNWTDLRISGRLGAQWHCLSGAPRRRGSLARGKALSLTCYFSNAMQLQTILMSYLTLGVL